MDFKRYGKITFVEDGGTVTVKDQNNETVVVYTDYQSRTNKTATERFFKEKGLELKDYSVRVTKKEEIKETWVYTRKKNVKFHIFIKESEDKEQKE